MILTTTLPDISKYWTTELISGNHVIDNQHHELLRRFEALENAITQGQGFPEVRALVAFLQRYVLTHFNTEEQEMLSGNFPGFRLHAAEHDKCKNRIFQFKRYIETETDRTKIVNVALSLVGLWVKDHILNHDIQFIQYIKEKGKRHITINENYQWTPETSKLWTPDLVIGIETIDDQHQELVKWAEYLMESTSLSESEIHGLLDFIHGFIFTHFTDEELLMIDIQYPDLQKHTDLHCETRNMFFEIQNQCTEQIDPREMHRKVLVLFYGYLEHIKTHDLGFRQYLHKLPNQ